MPRPLFATLALAFLALAMTPACSRTGIDPFASADTGLDAALDVADAAPMGEQLCDDGEDNDGDGDVDCVDTDCAESVSCTEAWMRCDAPDERCVDDTICFDYGAVDGPPMCTPTCDFATRCFPVDGIESGCLLASQRPTDTNRYCALPCEDIGGRSDCPSGFTCALVPRGGAGICVLATDAP